MARVSAGMDSHRGKVANAQVYGCLGILLATFVVIFCAPNLFSEVSADFIGKHHHSARRLRSANLTYKGPHMVRHQENYSKVLGEIFDFHGYHHRTACTKYHGIDHPNERGCCPESCGVEFCGTDNCDQGPGGNVACCESEMPRRWCSPHQMAPCMLNSTIIAQAFYDKPCVMYEGVDSPDKTACCPAICGEFCGADFCNNFGTDHPYGLDTNSQCCPSTYTRMCRGESAPCLLIKPTTATSTTSIITTSTSTSTSTKLRTTTSSSTTTTSTTKKPTTTSKSTTTKKTTTITESTRAESTTVKASTSTSTTSTSKATTTSTSTSTTTIAPGLHFAHLEGPFPPHEIVSLRPNYTGAHPVLFTIEPRLPEGLIFDKFTGTVHGFLGYVSNTSRQTYTIVASNVAGNITTRISLPIGLDLRYLQAPTNVSVGEKVKISPVYSGLHPVIFSIKPVLLAGLKFNSSTGEIHGVISNSTNLSLLKYVVFAKSAAGEVASEVGFNITKPTKPNIFPWWIVLVLALLLLLLVLFCRKRKEDEARGPYMPLEKSDPPAPASIKELDPEGFPLTFATQYGDKTVWATRKPLGLEFKKKLPVQITRIEGHGNELGIHAGWLLKSINRRDITDCTDIVQVTEIMHTEITKLPGGVPLAWTIHFLQHRGREAEKHSYVF